MVSGWLTIPDCLRVNGFLPLLLFNSCLLYSFPSYKEASLPLPLVSLFNTRPLGRGLARLACLPVFAVFEAVDAFQLSVRAIELAF